MNAIDYSPDGNALVFGRGDGSIEFFNVKSGKVKRTIKGHKEGVLTLSYSPDGYILVSGSMDKTIKLWDAKSGKLKQILKGHKEAVSALSYSLNDFSLISGSWDTSIKLWTPAMLQTQNLFYKYDSKQVSDALKFLWEMGLDDDLAFIYKSRDYDDSRFRFLLDSPAKGKTKVDQLIQWLEDKKAYKKQ